MLRKLIILSIFLFSVPAVYACSCAVKPTVLDMFNESAQVFTAKVVFVEYFPKDHVGSKNYPGAVKGAHAVVQKVYKGNVKPGDKVFFEQGGGADCIVTFNDSYDGKTRDDTGEEFLVYNYDSKLQNIRLNYCGRLGDKEDYSYLDNMAKLRGKTRFSGWYKPWLGEPGVRERLPKNAKIHIYDQGGEISTTYVATVDDKGFFEIYDIPPGEYKVSPQIPQGLIIDPYSLEYTYLRYYDLKSYEDFDGSWFPLKIEAGQHIRLDFMFTHHNPIRVKVVGPDGEPFDDVFVSLLRESADKPAPYQAPSDYTNKNGIALITEAKPGRYSVVLNPMNKVRGSNPFPTLYYPGTTERERADVFDIPLGGLKDTIVFRVGDLQQTVFIDGTLTYSDGTPAANEYVNFEPTTPKREGFDYESQSKTDANGRFRIKVLAGATGYLKVSDYVYEGEFEECLGVFHQLQKELQSEKTSFTVSARSADLTANATISNVELKFPFSYCAKGN